MNRRLIRPNFSEIKDKIRAEEASSPKPHPPSQGSRGPAGSQPPKKMHPPTDTSAENYYYLKQMSKKTPMAVVFMDGQTMEGSIEWYDRNCIKLNREGAPNLLVYKNALKYIYKLDEGKEGDAETDER